MTLNQSPVIFYHYSYVMLVLIFLRNGRFWKLRINFVTILWIINGACDFFQI